MHLLQRAMGSGKARPRAPTVQSSLAPSLPSTLPDAVNSLPAGASMPECPARRAGPATRRCGRPSRCRTPGTGKGSGARSADLAGSTHAHSAGIRWQGVCEDGHKPVPGRRQTPVPPVRLPLQVVPDGLIDVPVGHYARNDGLGLHPRALGLPRDRTRSRSASK